MVKDLHGEGITAWRKGRMVGQLSGNAYLVRMRKKRIKKRKKNYGVKTYHKICFLHI